MKKRSPLFYIALTIGLCIGLIFVCISVMVGVFIWQRDNNDFETGVTWVSDNPRMYVTGKDDGPPSCQLEIDGEMVDVYLGQVSTLVDLYVTWPGETEETFLLSASTWLSIGKDKITLYDIDYTGGYDLGYDKIVLRKQN